MHTLDYTTVLGSSIDAPKNVRQQFWSAKNETRTTFEESSSRALDFTRWRSNGRKIGRRAESIRINAVSVA